MKIIILIIWFIVLGSIISFLVLKTMNENSNNPDSLLLFAAPFVLFLTTTFLANPLMIVVTQFQEMNKIPNNKKLLLQLALIPNWLLLAAQAYIVFGFLYFSITGKDLISA